MERWHERIGAALSRPKAALEHADTTGARGQASSDISVYLLLVVIALEVRLGAMSLWLLRDRDFSGALMVLMSGLRDRLSIPIVLLLVGGAIVALGAGRKRRLSDDFDLACVAMVPLVTLELVNAWIELAGHSAPRIAQTAGYLWFAAILALAVLKARNRKIENAD